MGVIDPSVRRVALFGSIERVGTFEYRISKYLVSA
jgi:hypothetical protein